VVTRSIGTEPEVPVDEQSVALLEGDRILLCSDGLTGMVTEDQIQAILESTDDAQQAADRLIRAANRAGGIDNITAVVLDVREGEDPAGPVGTARATASRTPPGVRTGAPPSPRSLKKAGIALLISVAVLVLALIGVRTYVHSQWYVGVSDSGYVAVFQGIPGSPLGLHLSTLQTEYKDLSGADVASFDIYKELPNGITANSRTDAESIVTEMRTYVLTQRSVKGGPTDSPSPSAGAAS
jgi:protein phosphatase